MSSSDASRASGRRPEAGNASRRRRSSRSLESRNREDGRSDGNPREGRGSYRSSEDAYCKAADSSRYSSREAEEARAERYRPHSSRRPLGRMRGWMEGDGSSNTSSNTSSSSANIYGGSTKSSSSRGGGSGTLERDGHTRELRDTRRENHMRSRSRERQREGGPPSRGSGSSRQRSRSRSRHRVEGKDSSSRVGEEDCRRLPSRADRRGEGDHRTCRQSPSRLSSSKSKDRSGEKEEMRCQTSSSAVRDTDDGAGDSARGSRLPKRVLEEPAEDRELAAASSKASRKVSEERSASPSNSSDKISRLERFRALKRQKQQPEGGTSGKGTSFSSGSSSSSNAFNDWLPAAPNVKFAVGSSGSSSRGTGGSHNGTKGEGAAGATPARNGVASKAAAAAAIAAAQAVASAAAAAAATAAASAAAVAAPEERRQQQQSQQQQEASESKRLSAGEAQQAAASVGSVDTPALAVEGEDAAAAMGTATAAAEGVEESVMKPPKPMSRNRLKKHQQALLLKQLQQKTTTAAPEAKEDTDLLDAFMSALESEAKEELSAAKAEDEGQVEALECISSRAAEPPRLQSISLEEISRWQEVEANYLPPAAVAKAAGANAAVAPASTTEAATPPAAEGVKGEGEQQESLVAMESEETQAAAAACVSSDSPRVKQELEADAAAPSASVGAARQTASAGKTAAAQSAATDEGEGGVKAEGEASEASTATALSLAGGEGPNDEDEKYHELFLETLRKGRQKQLPRERGTKGGGGKEDKAEASSKDADVEEEEVLLYSDHEEEEEEAAAAAQEAAAAAEAAAALEQNTAGEDNDTQAKEQLANLSYFDLVKRVGLKKELPLVDHASCKFPPIKKNLYVQVKELTDLKDHEVEALRKTNGNIKVRGKQCPRPVSAFHQCGLPEKVLRHLEMRGFEKPFPVQSQCMPILMCGRDLIAVAETGSGKTLAYTLPLVRHVLSVKRQYKDYLAKQKEEKLQQQQQQELVDAAADGDANRVTSTPDSAAAAAESKGKPRGRQNAQDGDDQDRDRFRKNEKGERMLIYGNFKEGMIGLVIAPTRELSLQISKEVSRLCKLVDLNVASLYGGAGIGGQLGQIRRGVDVVVGTPGRLIDVLTLNSCKFTSLKRVTFVVLDEADRMFDYGFEPQISSILRSTRLDRQTCLFSATFPSHIESLARRILYKPIEVVVGEKGRTAAKVQQYVEVMDEERKFYRLLQLLGDWQDYGSIIIFVNKQIEADELFAELLKYGYQALVLHGGQDQTDREFTIQEFKDGTKTLLIATSVAARGLDVPSVVLVINYCCPSHIEDYVHRIGRTGRAGNIGVSYTFITPQEADKAEELEGALIQSGQTVPPALAALSSEFRVQCNMGLAQRKKRGGFGGKGFTFSVTERSRQQQQMQQAKKELSGANDFDEVEEVELLLQRDDFAPPPNVPQTPLALTNTMSTMDAAMAAAAAAAAARGGGAGTSSGSLQSAVEAAAAKAALLAKHQLVGTDSVMQPRSSTEAVARVKLVAKILKLQDTELAKRPPPTPPPAPPGLPPPGSEKTKLTIDQQVELMLQQALKGLPEADRGQYKEKLRDAYKKHLSPRPKVQQKVAPGMQLALASSVTGQAIPTEKDPFIEAAAEALSILKQGTTASSTQLQAALDKIKAFSDSGELAAAISSVSAPSNPTLGKVPGLSEKGFVCPETGNFVDELEINDYPQVARYKLTQKELMSRIMEETGAVLYVKGQHVEPALKHRTQLAPGVKFLHVEIIAPTPIQVQRARHAVYELVESIALKSLNLTATQRQSVGRYSVV
ncbi:uncharacterized protein LOC34617984 [Cyclospora cayetanensis]|uniref:RNA helicase n=1 Tax=Cyclospora cayetanensis TaxID=88456 RepID=A0A6P6RRA2_9EIME|nr:uncharacterized protein LOC34617984 [Cyclospora cayetanensis]